MEVAIAWRDERFSDVRTEENRAGLELARSRRRRSGRFQQGRRVSRS